MRAGWQIELEAGPRLASDVQTHHARNLGGLPNMPPTNRVDGPIQPRDGRRSGAGCPINGMITTVRTYSRRNYWRRRRPRRTIDPAKFQASDLVAMDLARCIADPVRGVQSLDINPIIVMDQGRGCVAVDAIVVRGQPDRA